MKRERREKRKREQLFLEKEAKILECEKGRKKRGAFLLLLFSSAVVKVFRLRTRSNYLFSWLYYEEKTTNSLTFTARTRAKRSSL